MQRGWLAATSGQPRAAASSTPLQTWACVTQPQSLFNEPNEGPSPDRTIQSGSLDDQLGKMSLPDNSIFTSKPFTFIVEGKPLYVHAALVADCSEPLNRMINGHLSEAQQGFAVLDEVDEETFLRFVRWTYSGDYPAREHSTVEPEEAKEEPTADLVADDDWGQWGSFTKKDKKRKKKVAEPAVKGFLRESFISHRRDTDPPTTLIPPARANKGPEEDYTEVLLGHARMYVFAEKYDIQRLKGLTLQKLQHQLAIHTLYIERVGEITALLKYVYANTMAPITTIHEEDGIRAMLAHYVGVEMATLVKEGGIKDLMLEDADLLGDFLRMFALRIN